MDKIDISAELLTLDSDQYYADWSVAEVTAGEHKTEVEVAVSTFQDAEYIDMTPIFDVLADSAETVGDRFYLKEIQFNPSGGVATIILTNVDIRSGETLSESYEEKQKNGRFYVIESDVLQDIDYENAPFLVGYRGEEEKLAIEL